MPCVLGTEQSLRLKGISIFWGERILYEIDISCLFVGLFNLRSTSKGVYSVLGGLGIGREVYRWYSCWYRYQVSCMLCVVSSCNLVSTSLWLVISCKLNTFVCWRLSKEPGSLSGVNYFWCKNEVSRENSNKRVLGTLFQIINGARKKGCRSMVYLSMNYKVFLLNNHVIVKSVWCLASLYLKENTIR